LRRRTFDTSVPLILWQVAFIGITTAPVAPNAHGFGVLVDYLLTFYADTHPAIVYQASPYPVGPANIGEFTVGNVRKAELDGMSTLYLPPSAEVPEDAEMRTLLSGSGIESSSESL
jgi:hypothetical protein